MMNKSPGPHLRHEQQIDGTHPRSRPGVNGTRLIYHEFMKLSGAMFLDSSITTSYLYDIRKFMGPRAIPLKFMSMPHPYAEENL